MNDTRLPTEEFLARVNAHLRVHQLQQQRERQNSVLQHTLGLSPASASLGVPDELNQVWTNLIHNAVQAMDGQGVAHDSDRDRQWMRCRGDYRYRQRHPRQHQRSDLRTLFYHQTFR